MSCLSIRSCDCRTNSSFKPEATMRTVANWDSSTCVDTTAIVEEVIQEVHDSSVCAARPCAWEIKTRKLAMHCAIAVCNVYSICVPPRLNNCQVSIIFRQVFVHIYREFEMKKFPLEEEDQARTVFIVRTIVTATRQKFSSHSGFNGFDYSVLV